MPGAAQAAMQEGEIEYFKIEKRTLFGPPTQLALPPQADLLDALRNTGGARKPHFCTALVSL
jgi:hypothetical protein